MTIKKHTKNLRHKQMKKELRERKKAAKVKEGRKPFRLWDTKLSLKKEVEGLKGDVAVLQGELSDYEIDVQIWERRYKQMFEENRKLTTENKALRAALKNRFDVTDNGYAREGVSV